jgi:hypothetical protein
MEVANAAHIVEECGCFFRYDDLMKAYTIYVGQSWAYIRPDALEKLADSQFKGFLLGFMAQEEEDLQRYGGLTKH